MSDQRILRSSAVMATGTVFSRASGFIRAALLVAALGAFTRGDLFTIAHTLPNMVYILLAGGSSTPSSCRSWCAGSRTTPTAVTPRKPGDHAVGALPGHGDRRARGGGAVAAAPLPSSPLPRGRPGHPAESIVDLTRWCLPQVFLYGMYVLVGQVLNARGRFGPMMWAPIANNVIAVAMLVVYLLVWGRATGAEQLAALDTVRRCCSAWARRSASPCSASSWCPTSARRASATALASTSATPSEEDAVARHLDRAVRHRDPGGVLRGRQAGLRRQSGRRAGVHRLQQQPADHDGAALDRHRVAGDGDPAAALAYAHEDRLAELGSTVGSTLRTALALVLPFAVLLPILAGDVVSGGLLVGRATPAQPSLRPWRSSVRRWSSSLSTTSCCAASMPWR